MMPARMYDLTAMKAPVEQPVLCRDLVSVQDFSPEETKSMFELTHIIKHRPAAAGPHNPLDWFAVQIFAARLQASNWCCSLKKPRCARV